MTILLSKPNFYIGPLRITSIIVFKWMDKDAENALKDIAKSMAFAFLAAELFAKKSKSE